MANYQKDGDRPIIDAFGGTSYGQKPVVNIKHSEARCPAQEVITKRPSYVLINQPGSYAFAYESGSAHRRLATFNVEGIDFNLMVGDESISSFASIDSKASNDGRELPFDVVSAFYGVLAGIATVLAGRLAWRTVSSRAPSTSESGLRLPRAPRVSQEKQEKKEVSCPYCEQRLKVPANHFGGAKCPACTMQFKVEEEPQPQFTRISVGESTTDQSTSRAVSESSEPVSRSSEDLLQCPDCDQTLRVPMDKRPVKSRCPVCKLEFMAKASEE